VPDTPDGTAVFRYASGMPPPDEIAQSLTERLSALTPHHAGRAMPAGLGGELRTIFGAQATSRQLDLAARRMQSAGRGYYTIASAGHESNAAVAAALRPSDPALLHYRSGGFYVRRAWQRPAIDPVADIVAG